MRSAIAPLLLVLAGCPPAEGPPGDTDTHDTEVEITSAAPHFLPGELVEVTAPATHRTRIPVAAG